MSKHQLGDAPIDENYREKMIAIAQGLNEMFNGVKPPSEREVGFILLVFPFGEKDGRCNYISNGADRRDVVTMLKEQIKRFEGQPDLTGHA